MVVPSWQRAVSQGKEIYIALRCVCECVCVLFVSFPAKPFIFFFLFQGLLIVAACLKNVAHYSKNSSANWGWGMFLFSAKYPRAIKRSRATCAASQTKHATNYQSLLTHNKPQCRLGQMEKGMVVSKLQNYCFVFWQQFSLRQKHQTWNSRVFLHSYFFSQESRNCLWYRIRNAILLARCFISCLIKFSAKNKFN